MVNVIGIVLGLQTECASGAIGLAVFAFYGRHRVGRVKLHTWLVCIGEHNNFCFIANGGGHRVAADHKVCIIAAEGFDAGFIIIRIPANGFGCEKIHSRAIYRNDFSRGDAIFPVDRIAIRIHLHNMPVDRSVSGTIEIKIAVICKVYNGILICLCIIFDLHRYQ